MRLCRDHGTRPWFWVLLSRQSSNIISDGRTKVHWDGGQTHTISREAKKMLSARATKMIANFTPCGYSTVSGVGVAITWGTSSFSRSFSTVDSPPGERMLHSNPFSGVLPRVLDIECPPSDMDRLNNSVVPSRYSSDELASVVQLHSYIPLFLAILKTGWTSIWFQWNVHHKVVPTNKFAQGVR